MPVCTSMALERTTAIDCAPQRLATLADVPRIAALMRASVLELFPHFYDARQTASAAVHIADIDVALIEDGTYFVHGGGGRDRRVWRLEPAQQAVHGLGRR